MMCWDLNANGVGDPLEDINNDTFFNTNDAPAQRAQRVPPVRRVTRGPQALPGRKATPVLRVQRALPALKVPLVPKAPLEPMARQAQQV